MGYDIEIWATRDGEPYRRATTIYLTYNFGHLGSYCSDHPFNDKCIGCDDKLKHLWSARQDVMGRTSESVIELAQDALSKLRQLGVQVGVPDLTNRNWSYGTAKVGNGPIPRKEMLSVLMFHIHRFLAVAQTYPEHTFYDEEAIMFAERAEGSDDDEPAPPVLYFRHPLEGNIAVTTFKKAMEVYGILMAQGNKDMADIWYDAGLAMPDAPGQV